MVESAPDLPPVAVDEKLILRALSNLLENAVTYSEPGGRITLAASGEGDGVVLTVADTGAGIDAAVKDRLFEPFFSTKTSGSGLGLALVKRIAEDHGGGVSLETAPGGGTRAVLWLPADPPASGV